MNRCPNCAAQNRDGAKFCTSCGFKLPVLAEAAHERSPFTTTSYVPTSAGIDVRPESDAPVQADDASSDQSFSTWDLAPAEGAVELPGPGSSWDAEPPRDTAVPVSDEMIETLVGGDQTESWQVDAHQDRGQDQMADELRSTFAVPSMRAGSSAPSPTIDHLLKIARELEYGLIELAEAGQAPASSQEPVESTDTSSLSDLLAGLQSDDELEPLRGAIETARERPRDVDVMLDLVLRAEAIAAVIDERDRLKAAVEAALGVASEGDESLDEEAVDELDAPEPGEDEPEQGEYAST